VSGANVAYDPAGRRSVRPRRSTAVEGAIRPRHLGDRAPVLLARRELGALPPAARPTPASGSTPPAGGHRRPTTPGRAELEAERDERVLVEERVDVTLPWDRRPAAPGTR
jgi:phenylalanyl-tRNA synthetase alpha chain